MTCVCRSWLNVYIRKWPRIPLWWFWCWLAKCTGESDGRKVKIRSTTIMYLLHSNISNELKQRIVLPPFLSTKSSSFYPYTYGTNLVTIRPDFIAVDNDSLNCDLVTYKYEYTNRELFDTLSSSLLAVSIFFNISNTWNLIAKALRIDDEWKNRTKAKEYCSHRSSRSNHCQY